MGRKKISQDTQTLFIRSIRTEDKDAFDRLCHSQGKTQAQVFQDLIATYEAASRKK